MVLNVYEVMDLITYLTFCVIASPLVRASTNGISGHYFRVATVAKYANFYPIPGFIAGKDDIFFDYYIVLGKWPRNLSLWPLIRDLSRLLLRGCVCASKILAAPRRKLTTA